MTMMRGGLVFWGIMLFFILAVPASGGDGHDEDTCAICQLRREFNALADWLEVGGDFRLRTTYKDATKLDSSAAGHDQFFQRYRPRVWSRMHLSDELDFNFGLTAEPRYYWRPDREDQFINDEVIIDRLNFKWVNPLDVPMTAVIGRQDIKLGSNWLIQRGTPGDGSRSYFFDAARFTFQPREDTTVDMIYIENHANSSAWLHPINDQDIDFEEQDARGAIVYASRQLNADERVDGYFLYKHDYNPPSSSGSEGDIYTFGGLYKKDLDDNWSYHVELAPQFGQKNGKDLVAFATNNFVSYDFHDENDQRVIAGYEYLSGDDDPDRHFDKMWGRRSAYSELYNASISSLDGRVKDSTNLHRIYVGWHTSPSEKTELATYYHVLFADENINTAGAGGLSSDGMFKGHLITSQFTLMESEHFRHRILGELFLPGNYYNDDRNDPAVFLRYELMFTW